MKPLLVAILFVGFLPACEIDTNTGGVLEILEDEDTEEVLEDEDTEEVLEDTEEVLEDTEEVLEDTGDEDTGDEDTGDEDTGDDVPSPPCDELSSPLWSMCVGGYITTHEYEVYEGGCITVWHPGAKCENECVHELADTDGTPYVTGVCK